MKLRYKLTGTGWSATSLEDEDGEVAVSASYLSDALGDLARGALAVLRGSGEVRFSFCEEPGEFRWVLKKKNRETYSLTILEFVRLWGEEPDEVGQVIVERAISRVGFGLMVLKALEDVRHEHGDEGYKEKWVEHDFPVQELAELRARIDEERA